MERVTPLGLLSPGTAAQLVAEVSQLGAFQARGHTTDPVLMLARRVQKGERR